MLHPATGNPLGFHPKRRRVHTVRALVVIVRHQSNYYRQYLKPQLYGRTDCRGFHHMPSRPVKGSDSCNALSSEDPFGQYNNA